MSGMNFTVTEETAKLMVLCYGPSTRSWKRCPQGDLQHGQAEACCKALSESEGTTFEVIKFAHMYDLTAACTAMGSDGQDSYVWTNEIVRGPFSFAAMDGCKIRNYGSLERSSAGQDRYWNTWDTHAVRCCTYDGAECITPTHFGCESTATWWEANAACHEIGMRLCKLSEMDDDKCCQSGCMFDVDAVWTSSVVYHVRLHQMNENGGTCDHKEDVATNNDKQAFVCCGPDNTCVDPVPNVCLRRSFWDASVVCRDMGMELCRDSKLCSTCKHTKCFQDGAKILGFKSYVS